MGHISLYICDPNFSCGLTNLRTDGRTEVFHEALADLKKIENLAGVKKEDKFYVFFPIRNKDSSSEYKYSADTVLVPDYCLVL